MPVSCFRPFSNIEEDVDDIECDNPECPEEVQELKQEILSAYQQLKNMCSLLRQRGSGGKQRRNSTDSLETTSSSEEPRASQVRVGLLHEVMQELKGLLHDILRKEAKGSCPACGADVNDRLKLEVQLHKTTENFEKLERNLKKKEDESRAREDEMRELMSKLSVTELQLKAAEEDRDTLRSDLENSEAGRDVLIKKAWETRDAAVKRKNNTEIELARTRIDVMQVCGFLALPIYCSRFVAHPGEQPADGGDPAEGGALPAARPVAAGHAGAARGADEQENGRYLVVSETF